MAATSNEPDELYTLRNYFFLGSYQMAINEANSLNRLNPQLASEKQEYVLRCYLAMGQSHVIFNEVKDSSPLPLKALKILAKSFADPLSKDGGRLELLEMLRNSRAFPSLNLIAALFHLHDGNVKDAILLLGQEGTLEQSALLVQTYLRLDRIDLAQKILKSMQSKDEDGVLTVLASAWINLYAGPTKAQDAVFAYDELIDKYGSSVSLLNGLALAKMQLGNFEEAEAHLLEALTKSPGDSDTVANLITVSQHLNRSSDVIDRYIGQIQSKTPSHPILTACSQFESTFDKVATTIEGK